MLQNCPFQRATGIWMHYLIYGTYMYILHVYNFGKCVAQISNDHNNKRFGIQMRDHTWTDPKSVNMDQIKLGAGQVGRGLPNQTLMKMIYM